MIKLPHDSEESIVGISTKTFEALIELIPEKELSLDDLLAGLASGIVGFIRLTANHTCNNQDIMLKNLISLMKSYNTFMNKQGSKNND